MSQVGMPQPVKINCTLLFEFNRPPVTVSVVRFATGSTPSSSAVLTRSAAACGSVIARSARSVQGTEYKSPITPAVNGDAKEVPDVLPLPPPLNVVYTALPGA